MDTGTVDAFIVSIAPTYNTSYTDGMTLKFKASNACTGPCTINVNSLGVKSIVRPDGTAPQFLDIVSGQIVTITYSTTDGKFHLGNAYGGPAGPAASAGLVLLDTVTAAASASMDFNSLISSTYDKYVFDIINFVPATNTAQIYIRTSSDGGSTYDAGGSDYVYCGTEMVVGAGALNFITSAGAARIATMANGISNTEAHGGANGRVELFNPAGAAFKQLTYQLSWMSGAAASLTSTGQGTRVSASAVNAVRFLASSGNITSGTIHMYGVNKA